MIAITLDNARKWIVAASVCLFVGAAINVLVFTPFTLLDAVIFITLAIFILRESRTASTIAFCYYVLGKFCVLGEVFGNGVTLLIVMAVSLCLLQGMRSTYFIHKYPSFVGGKKYEPGEIVDTDFEFIEPEVPQSEDRK